MEVNAVKTRNKVSLKNMEYTRYIGIRYALALFLFTNLNWMIALFLSKSVLVFIPFLLLTYVILAVYEQIKVYSKKDLPLKHTKSYFITQAIVNLFLIAGSFYSPFYNKAFPFMSNSSQGILGIAFIIGLGLIISLSSVRKINKIEQQEDRLFKEVLKYKNALKVSEKNGRKK